MTPNEYFTAFVLGNQQDCAENPGCLRRAFNAAVSASHMADHYFAFSSRHMPGLVSKWPNNAAFVRHLIQDIDGAFGDIRSISNAYKHLYEERKSGRPAQWTVSSGGSLESVQFEGALRPLQSMESDYGTPDEDRLAVVFRRRDGTSGEFLPALERVVQHWEATLWPEGGAGDAL
jgi:hypothetical protein